MTGIWAPWQAYGEESLEPKDLFMPMPSCLFFPSGFDVCIKYIIACTFLI